MSFYTYRFLLSGMLFLGSFCFGTAQVLPEESRVDWSLAGCTESPGNWSQLNILDFGGINDGSSSNNAAFANALAFLNGGSGILFFPEGDYRFDEPLVLPDRFIIRGAGANQTKLLFDLQTADYAIQIIGEETNLESQVTKSIIRNDNKLDVAGTAQFQQGDYVLVYDLDTAKVESSWAKYTTGQINQVTNVSASSLRFRSPFRRAYNLGDFPRVSLLRPRRMVGIEQLGIIRLDEPAEKNSNIFFHIAANCWVKCVESDYCDFAHVEIARSTNIEIKGSYFHHAFNYGGDGKGYGVALHYSAGECVVENNIFNNLRHSMLLQAGANGNVVSYNYSVNPYWDQPGFPNNAAGDLVLHGNYPYANLLEGNIVQNIVIDDSHGAQGPMNTFFRNRAEGYGLIMGSDPAPTAQNLIGNEISNDLSLFLIYGSDHFLFGNNIQGDIEPAGTQFLDDASYYMDSIPVYFQIPDAWPAIGVPHDLGTVINEAFARYQEKAYTACTNADFAPPVQALTTDIDFIIPEDSFELYPNPSKGQLFFRSQIATSVEYWEIIGIDGSIRLSGSTLPRKLDLMRLQNGFYMFSIKLEDGNRLNKPFSLVK